MELTEYRRPPNDTGIGFHFTAADTQGDIVWMVKQYATLAKEMHASWFKCLDLSYDSTRAILDLGMEPVQRVYKKPSGGIACDGGLLHRYDLFIEAGGRYCDPIWNEVNVWDEYGDYPNAYKTAELWVPWANHIADKGGYPGTPSLSPGANEQYPGGDTGFLKDFCFYVNLIDPDIWDRGVFIGLHNYTLNHPPDYAEDRCGFLGYLWVNNAVLEKTGKQLPMVSTEHGSVIGNKDDARFPEVSPELHAQWAVEMALHQPPEWLFAHTCYWLIANDGGNPVWQPAAWFGDGNPILDLSINAMRGINPPVEETVPMPLNYQPGRTEPVERLIVHHTGMGASGVPTPSAIRNYFESTRGTANPVSAHYIIGWDGEILPYIPVTDTAWHAALANADTVGVELCGDGNLHQFSEAQYVSLATVIRQVELDCPAFVASTATVLPHSAVTAGKVDPGALFDWPKLWRYLEVTDVPTPNTTPGGRDWRSWLQPGQPEDPLLVIDNLVGVNDLHGDNLTYLRELVEAANLTNRIESAIAGQPIRPE